MTILILSVIVLLLSNAVTLRRDKSILYSRVGIIILVLCFLICYNSFVLKFNSKGLGVFSGLYLNSAITHVFHMVIFVITSIILLITSFHPRKLIKTPFVLHNLKYRSYHNFISNKMAEQFRIIEYPLIVLFVVIGGVLLVSSNDLISIFLSIELQSYGLYILCAIYRDSERGISGALTYFLLGGLSSCFILLASALLYSNSGNSGFDGLYIINNISNVKGDFYNVIEQLGVPSYEPYYIHFSLVVMSVGFLFKISAAPFHFWSPDVYDAIPTVVTTFVAVFAKLSILILMLELVHYTNDLFISQFNPEGNILSNMSWTFSLLISSLLSFIIGSLLGLTQFRIKRLYAYSTISHIGFILLALTINTVDSIQSFVFYLIQYSFSNLNAFIILITIGYSLYHMVENVQDNTSAKNINEFYLTEQMSDRNNSPIQLISQLKGYFFINPFLAISLAITLFSFVGIPPLIGFFAKQMVLSSALNNGYVFMVVIAILTSVISAFYYLALIRQMFFNKTDYVVNTVVDRYIRKNSTIPYHITLSSFSTISISVLTLVILLFILIPQESLNLSILVSTYLFKS